MRYTSSTRWDVGRKHIFAEVLHYDIGIYSSLLNLILLQISQAVWRLWSNEYVLISYTPEYKQREKPRNWMISRMNLPNTIRNQRTLSFKLLSYILQWKFRARFPPSQIDRKILPHRFFLHSCPLSLILYLIHHRKRSNSHHSPMLQEPVSYTHLTLPTIYSV